MRLLAVNLLLGYKLYNEHLKYLGIFTAWELYVSSFILLTQTIPRRMNEKKNRFIAAVQNSSSLCFMKEKYFLAASRLDP